MKLFFQKIVTVLIVSSSLVIGMGNYPNDMMMSQEEMMQQYEELQRNIDEYIASLSPEEQKEFYEAQQMYADMFSKMSEEERNQLLEEMYKAAEEEMTQYYSDLEKDVIPNEPSVHTELQFEDQKTETVPVIEYSKYSLVIQYIQTILTRTESFLVKLNSIPDIASRVFKWTNFS